MNVKRAWIGGAMIGLLVFGMVAVTGGMINFRMNQLQAKGVEGIATVDQLRTFQSGSGNSRSTTYRVQMRVHDGDQVLPLTDDVSKERFDTMSEGGLTPVVYIPGNKDVCLVGDQSDVAEVSTLSFWCLYGGSAGFIISLFVGIGSWFYFDMPSIRSIISGQEHRSESSDPITSQLNPNNSLL